MIKDTSKTLPKIKATGYFYNIFGDICPVCNKNILGKNFCHTSNHSYFYDSITLASHNEHYLCYLSKNKIEIGIMIDYSIYDYKIIYSDSIDSSDKDLIKNAKQTFDNVIKNMLFL